MWNTQNGHNVTCLFVWSMPLPEFLVERFVFWPLEGVVIDHQHGLVIDHQHGLVTTRNSVMSDLTASSAPVVSPTFVTDSSV